MLSKGETYYRNIVGKEQISITGIYIVTYQLQLHLKIMESSIILPSIRK